MGLPTVADEPDAEASRCRLNNHQCVARTPEIRGAGRRTLQRIFASLQLLDGRLKLALAVSQE